MIFDYQRMKLNKSAFIKFIECVTISLTLLNKTTISSPLTQPHNVKHTSQQKHFENSITLKEMYHDNSEYLSYGNEIYDTYNDNNLFYKATAFKEKDSKYSKQASSKKNIDNNYHNEQYPSKYQQQEGSKCLASCRVLLIIALFLCDKYR